MPLYEYQCDVCGHRFEVIQKFSDPLVKTCPKCQSAVHKLFSSPAIQFKGSGFYITDYPKADHANAAKADQAGATNADGAKSDTSGKADKTDKAGTSETSEKAGTSTTSEKTAGDTSSASVPSTPPPSASSSPPRSASKE